MAVMTSDARGSWLNPKLGVGPSPIAGLGLFAVARIDVGAVCARLGGTFMTDAEFAAHIERRNFYSALAIDEGLHLVQADNDPTTKGNHSCDPNLWLAGAVTVVARRVIELGEEAAIDYALMTADPVWSMECRCRAANCRRQITGADWRLPDLQVRYRGHWSPFITRRIDKHP
jgi:uncharacterized protein